MVFQFSRTFCYRGFPTYARSTNAVLTYTIFEHFKRVGKEIKYSYLESDLVGKAINTYYATDSYTSFTYSKLNMYLKLIFILKDQLEQRNHPYSILST